jgi:hypothetical protein
LLDILFFRITQIAQELLHALVHDALCKHLSLEEFAKELGET